MPGSLSCDQPEQQSETLSITKVGKISNKKGGPKQMALQRKIAS